MMPGKQVLKFFSVSNFTLVPKMILTTRQMQKYRHLLCVKRLAAQGLNANAVKVLSSSMQSPSLSSFPESTFSSQNASFYIFNQMCYIESDRKRSKSYLVFKHRKKRMMQNGAILEYIAEQNL